MSGRHRWHGRKGIESKRRNVIESSKGSKIRRVLGRESTTISKARSRRIIITKRIVRLHFFHSRLEIRRLTSIKDEHGTKGGGHAFTLPILAIEHHLSDRGTMNTPAPRPAPIRSTTITPHNIIILGRRSYATTTIGSLRGMATRRAGRKEKRDEGDDKKKEKEGEKEKEGKGRGKEEKYEELER